MSRPKGSKLTLEHKTKIANALKGNTNGRFGKGRKLGFIPKRAFKKGFIPWNKGTKGIMKAWNKGKKMPKSMSEKMRVIASNRTGEKAANWIDGRSFKPYPCGFTDKLKLEIRQRDNFICQLCNITEDNHYEKLAIHHIDYNKENLDKNNLITLCRSCNSKVNANRESWSNFFKEKIQRL